MANHFAETLGLNDRELMDGIEAIQREERCRTVQIIECLVEIDRRGLDRSRGHASMFEFCRRELGMSERTADRYTNAAHLVRRFPWLLEKVEGGALNLSALELLRDFVTDENAEELVREASGKTKSELRHLLTEVPLPSKPPAESPMAVEPRRARRGRARYTRH